MITKFVEYKDITDRAMRIARKSWSTEHASTPAKDLKLMMSLCKLGSSHSAALRQTKVYMDITATRAFWAEFDKYRIGTEMYSESTMHTLKKKPLSAENFYRGVVDLGVLETLNTLIADKASLVDIKLRLPEGFLQTRAVEIAYPALQGMYRDRIDHKWPEWKVMLEELLELVAYPGLITVLADHK